MIRHFLVFLLFVATFSSACPGQTDPWRVVQTPNDAGLRGLSAVNKRIAWACGGKGTVIRTVDGGEQWQLLPVPSLENAEIRSLHAWDAEQAIVAVAGQPAVIFKTMDGGKHWKRVYENKSPKAFIDGMRFSDPKHGIAFSDPVDGALLILVTDDGGDTWKDVNPKMIPAVDTGEAGFAASNSSLHVLGSMAWIGLGGGQSGPSRVLLSQDRGRRWNAVRVGMIPRSESAGIFSIVFDSELRGVAVGGDYKAEGNAIGNIALSDDGGLSWRAAKGTPPRGFRSSVVGVSLFAKRSVWITAGPAGCDWSHDRENWTPLSETGFHALSVAQDNSVWGCGSAGRVGILDQAIIFSKPQ